MIENKPPTLKYELTIWKGGFQRVAGIDEAGRGAWAGPVVAAAVILPVDRGILRILEGVRDSKLMTPRARALWAPRIRQVAVACSTGIASCLEIDTLGILPATRLAAVRSLETLDADYLLTDYLVFSEVSLPQTALVKGDRLSLSVAAASVLAKTTRDALMCELEQDYPGFGFSRHKGYGTLQHRQEIIRLGQCAIHRKSYTIPH
jgi:ribonuclease HII